MTDERHESTANTARRGADGSSAMTTARAIVDVTRDLVRTVPPPRGAPYFCLDSGASYDLTVLDAFYARGIFRKYEFVLELGSGLGGRARWLATRSGCRILGVDPSPDTVAAARFLNYRARLDGQVSFQVGRLHQLPVRARVFTHVWMVGAAGNELAAALAESFRVLRPGGHVALQHAPATPQMRADLGAALGRAGFVDLDVCEVTCAELPPPCRLARDRLRPRRGQLPAAEPEGRPALQLFATRPA